MLRWTVELFSSSRWWPRYLDLEGIAVAAAGIARILFFIFLILFIASLMSGLIRRACEAIKREDSPRKSQGTRAGFPRSPRVYGVTEKYCNLGGSENEDFSSSYADDSGGFNRNLGCGHQRKTGRASEKLRRSDERNLECPGRHSAGLA